MSKKTRTERKKRLKRAAVLTLIGVFLAAAAVIALKIVIRRASVEPYYNFADETAFVPPAYTGEVVETVSGGFPFFTEDEMAQRSFMSFSPLDALGRCGTAFACLGPDTLADEERGEIGMIKPSGWHTARYDDLISDKYLYNRCHLIAFVLSGENANERNLITGTRHMNVSGMLPYEVRTADYIRETGNHVMYRVTPCFEGNDLVASGVLMEARSVEDGGSGLMFCVFVHNVQPGIVIDYHTGESEATETSDETACAVSDPGL